MVRSGVGRPPTFHYSQLRNHTKVHKKRAEELAKERIYDSSRPHECSFCNKAFRKKNELRLHTSHHTGDKEFSCAYCNKAFVTSSVVKVHERIHTGEMPFSCLECQKKFNQSSHMYTHMKTHKIPDKKLDA